MDKDYKLTDTQKENVWCLFRGGLSRKSISNCMRITEFEVGMFIQDVLDATAVYTPAHVAGVLDNDDWSHREEVILRRMKQRGRGLSYVSAHLARTPGAIKRQWKDMLVRDAWLETYIKTQMDNRRNKHG